MLKNLGFTWDRSIFPTDLTPRSVDLVCFRMQKNLTQFVWDAATLEGNTHTFPEVKTLLEGITVGGHKLQEQEQVLNLIESHKFLLNKVKQKKFDLTKALACELNNIVVKHEALEWGHFRGEGREKNVKITVDGWYIPPLEPELNDIFTVGVSFLANEIENILERAITYFLFGVKNQFFFDGNKRTSKLMMNGVLLSHGIDAISVPAADALEFNQKMLNFYRNQEASEIMLFLIDTFKKQNLD